MERSNTLTSISTGKVIEFDNEQQLAYWVGVTPKTIRETLNAKHKTVIYFDEWVLNFNVNKIRAIVFNQRTDKVFDTVKACAEHIEVDPEIVIGRLTNPMFLNVPINQKWVLQRVVE